jgi:Uma2 family endonuclease
MAIATQMTVEEYRNADFEGDPEYVNGEVLDRNVGEADHSLTIRNLISYIALREAALGIFALQTWTFKLTERHYRVPDFVIVTGPEPDEQILETPPLVCVEVLSPEDRAGPMLRKIADFCLRCPLCVGSRSTDAAGVRVYRLRDARSDGRRAAHRKPRDRDSARPNI